MSYYRVIQSPLPWVYINFVPAPLDFGTRH